MIEAHSLRCASGELTAALEKCHGKKVRRWSSSIRTLIGGPISVGGPVRDGPVHANLEAMAPQLRA